MNVVKFGNKTSVGFEQHTQEEKESILKYIYSPNITLTLTLA